MKHFFTKSVLVILLFQFFGSVTYGQNWDKVLKSVPDDRKSFNIYGYSVAISNNYAVIGSMGVKEDSTGSDPLENSGAVYVLHNDGTSWKQVKKIYPHVRKAADYFGCSVGISVDKNHVFVMVGAMRDDEDAQEMNPVADAGSVYIFEKDYAGDNAWGQLDKITAPERIANNLFGKSIAIHGDYAIVGSEYENAAGGSPNSSGAAYIFTKGHNESIGWRFLKKLVASDGSSGDYFGTSVSISDNYAVIGANGKSWIADGNTPVYRAGAAYIFKKDGSGVDSWSEVKKLVASNHEEGDGFGTSVAISDDYAVIGAEYEGLSPEESNVRSYLGSAYIFKNALGSPDNWGLIKKVTAPVRENYDHFGISVAISGNYVMVGATEEDHDSQDNNYLENSGSAYIFSKDNGGSDKWGQLKKITASTRSSRSNFGFAIGISGQNALVGASLESNDLNEADNKIYAGAAYFISSTSVPLPVTLTSFNAVKSEKQAFLQWNTSTETRSDYFEIQRSRDGKNWNILGTVQASSESNSIRNYTFVDQKPLSNENMYRLKMVDTDNTFAFSTIKSVSFSDLAQAALYPNPVSDKVYVTADDVNKVKSVNIINAAGQVVLKSSGINNEISVQSLHNGFYVIRVTYENGQTVNSKVVIAK